MSNASSDKNLILSLNAGSSSLKISLYEPSAPSGSVEFLVKPVKLLLKSTISSISSPPAQFSFESVSLSSQCHKDEKIDSITDHASAFSHFLHCLKQEASIDGRRITRICHRVVHGGDYTDPVEISQEAYDHIENLSDLAPLHNSAALSVIKACISTLPDAKSIAYFDTTFHTTLPIHISSYAIDQNIAHKKGLKKYGFHGLSYAFILNAVSQYLQKPKESLNLILLHLGSGASACAVQNGKSLDTSMGLTPLSGLPGATRSGTIDPSLIFHYTARAGRMSHDPNVATHVGVTRAEDLLNRKSGWKALTGTTDFGVIASKAELGNRDPALSAQNPYRLAFDLFVDRILDFVGSYHLKLKGDVDAIVFAGGIGERSVELRAIVSDRIACLGYRALCPEKNERASSSDNVVQDISAERRQEANERPKRILICRTDEQLEMARQCAQAHF
ncbi:hypothetical protein CVT24_010328 [Panaeolus cyanescens]|uniref:Probable acetate kinase n=1 Tax=Panaeolus cyanescens TaxID=181874 RepID=A0A409VE85_9AGAR|nr:hypothetical protein CVT24_010328 [Panaeolus cyanescens]